MRHPPDWRKHLTSDVLGKMLNSPEMSDLLRRVEKNYYYWDKFRHLKFPHDVKAEEAWAYIKLRRPVTEQTPILSLKGESFVYSLTKTIHQRLNFIDMHAAGVKSLNQGLHDMQASRFIMSSLTEEAIASSQIEGANTTRKVAKEMLLTARAPRNRDEQMILNNYRMMQRVESWKGLELTESILIEMQSTLTENVLSEEDGRGRFRRDDDDIVIHDPLSGEIVHRPPPAEEMRTEVGRLLAYANSEDEDGEFTHPVIKAAILHFWLSYLHPFVDGNGRSARALFYWYLLKREYWLVQYTAVSRAIKLSRKAYDDSFLQSELDDNDLTYFLLYITRVFEQAVEQFLAYFKEKQREAQLLKDRVSKTSHYNARQLSLLSYFRNHEKETVDVVTHQNKNGVSRPTAYNDLHALVSAGLLTEMRRGKKFIYVPNINKIKRLIG